MYIALLSEFSFPKKRKQNKSNFRMVNLCNSGTKDFVELWKIIHWNIWMQLSYFIMVKPVQKTTSVKLPMLSSPKQIPVQSLLSNMTSNQFFWLPNEKNLHKTTAKLYPAKECKKKKHKEHCIKNKCIYSRVNYFCKKSSTIDFRSLMILSKKNIHFKDISQVM